MRPAAKTAVQNAAQAASRIRVPVHGHEQQTPVRGARLARSPSHVQKEGGVMTGMMLFKPRFETVARQLRGRHFDEVAHALRTSITPILNHWRAQSLIAVPELDRLTIAEFEDSMALILRAVAAAMKTDDPEQLRNIIEHAPLHGGDRFLKDFTLDALLAEESTLRGAIVVVLREAMGRPLTEGEAAALHELIGITLDHSILAFVHKRSEQMHEQMAGVQRLADLGTLVAGVAHDAANLLLPFRISVERLKHCELPVEARSHVQIVEHVFQHYQNTILNLRWLSVDAAHRPTAAYSLDLHAFGKEFQSFQRLMLPRAIALEVDFPEGLPHVRLSQAALSQILFNLIANAQHAILSECKRGRIAITAQAGPDDTVRLSVEDDGPGMPEHVRKRCTERYFTTKQHDAGTGLGLALVQSLMAGVDGTVEVHSPPPGKPADAGGTLFVLTFKCAAESFESAVAKHTS
jgi:signal transduction histidine kinase